jgi:hypothetical protein
MDKVDQELFAGAADDKKPLKTPNPIFNSKLWYPLAVLSLLLTFALAPSNSVSSCTTSYFEQVVISSCIIDDALMVASALVLLISSLAVSFQMGKWVNQAAEIARGSHTPYYNLALLEIALCAIVYFGWIDFGNFGVFVLAVPILYCSWKIGKRGYMRGY